jgi:hypothetical protein
MDVLPTATVPKPFAAELLRSITGAAEGTSCRETKALAKPVFMQSKKTAMNRNALIPSRLRCFSTAFIGVQLHF